MTTDRDSHELAHESAPIADAWRAAQGELPLGWRIYDLTSYAYDRDCGFEWPGDRWEARAGIFEPGRSDLDGRYRGQTGEGDSPASALRDLADKLANRKPVHAVTPRS